MADIVSPEKRSQNISPESTPEQIEAIFASMAKHLYGAGN